MRSMLAFLLWMLVWWQAMAHAQPADCPVRQAPGLPLPLGIDLAGRPGIPKGVTGEAYVAVPLQAPVIDCGEAVPPRDVLRGEPGDLLRGTPAPTRR